MRLNWGAFTGIFLLLASCNYYQGKIGTTLGPGPGEKLTFAVINQYMTTPFCLRCHNSEVTKGGVDFSLPYEQYVSDGLITPGNPSDSLYFTEIRDGSMPESGPKPSEALIKMVKAWIENGAPKE